MIRVVQADLALQYCYVLLSCFDSWAIGRILPIKLYTNFCVLGNFGHDIYDVCCSSAVLTGEQATKTDIPWTPQEFPNDVIQLTEEQSSTDHRKAYKSETLVFPEFVLSACPDKSRPWEA